jgi:murein lipoprotein
MKQNTTSRPRVLALIAMAAIYTGVTGCATTGDLDKLRSDVDAANAQSAAASQDAAEAKVMAQEALNTANEANATSMETETKIDRMFKKAMYK